MASPLTTNESESNPMPIWLSLPLILLSLALGGWIIHWYIISDPLAHDAKLLAEPARAVAQPGGGQPRGGGGGGGGGGQPNGWGGWFGNNNRPNRPPYVYLTQRNGNERLEVKTETADAAGETEKKTGSINLRMTYNNYSFLPEEIRAKFAATNSLVRDQKRIDALGLSEADRNRLRSFSNNTEIAVTAADKEMLKAEFSKYIKASDAERPALEKQLFAAVEQTAQKYPAATSTLAQEHAAAIDKIMTPELWTKNAALLSAAAAATPATPATPENGKSAR